MRRTIASILFTLIAVTIVAMPAFAQTPVEPVYLPLIIAAATPLPTTAPPQTTAPTPTTAPVPEKCPAVDRAMELEVLRLINVERAKARLKALVEDGSLTVAARCFAMDIAAHDIAGHIGSDGSRSWERVAAAGYSGSYAGEIAGSGGDAQGMVNWWMGSSAHKSILLSPDVTEFGAGYGYTPNSYWKSAWVVDFGRR